MKFSLFLLFIGFYSITFAQKEKKYLAQVRLDGKCGFIDVFGKEMVPLIYDDAGLWGNNLVPVNIGKYTPEVDPVTVEVILPGSIVDKDSVKRNEQYKTVEIKKEEKGKWGYCNAWGALVIPVQFTNAEFFSEGMAGVEVGGKWGFINTEGKIIVRPVYDKVGHFSQGLAVVAKDGNYGYINLKGEEVIKLQYVGADVFKNGFARVSEKHNSKNNKKTSIGRLINLKGETVTDAKYDIETIFSNGLASFSLSDANFENSFIYGLINIRGQIVAQPIYKEISDFSNGLAKVMVYKKDKVYDEYYPNYGYIDSNGKEIVKVGLAKAEDFNYNMAVIARFDDKDDGMLDHALINTKGVFVLGYNYRSLTLLDSKNLLANLKNKHEDILINNKGEKILSLEDKKIVSLGNGLFSITNIDEEPVALIGLDKKKAIDFSQNKRKKFLSYQFGLIRFCDLDRNDEESAHAKLGLIDLNGKVIVKPRYNEILDFELTEGSLSRLNQ